MQQVVAQSQRIVLVVDPMVLRRAAWMSLLRPWAAANGVGLEATEAEGIASAMPPGAACALGLLSLGGLSLRSQPAAGWMERMKALDGAPTAVVADSEAFEEIVAAYRGGARGYITTAIPPEIALEAFSFIMRGGSFFPPGPLLEKAEARSRTRPADHDGNPGTPGAAAVHSLLTSRQLDVLMHLRAGMSNKAIARLLGMHEATVKAHVRGLLRKLGAVNRTQAALSALGAGLEPPAPANDDEPRAGGARPHAAAAIWR